MGIFFIFIIVILLLSCSALFSGLTIGILSLNHYELKRKAQLGNKDARAVYPIRAYGHQLMVSLLIGNIVANATIVAILMSRMHGFYAVILTTIAVVLFGEILPMIYIRKHSLTVAARLSGVLKYLLLGFTPIAKPLGTMLDKQFGDEGSSVYSKEELYKILEKHTSSEFSDIEADEVEIVRHALEFGDKQVREVMTPRRVVTAVEVDDVIGPILIDELHKTGHSRFPVFGEKKRQSFVGTLYLHDLVNGKRSGKVRDVMRKNVYYVHEQQSLDHALRAFLRTNHHLFIVVNSFEEFVGVVSFEDIIEQIIGKQVVDEFDQHEDMRAVAKSLADKDRKKRESTEKK